MHALITRPLEDAKPLADLLAARGVDCVVEPLLEIVPHPEAVVDLDGVQALMFTSANGVRAFAAKSSRRDLKALTVGDGSAATARAAGFTDVMAASGDVDTLAALAIARLDPRAGPLFHGAGSTLAGDLQGKLEAAGFTLRRAVLYESKTATAFSPETRMNLALGGIDMVLLFSPRTARTFADLWREAEKPNLGKTSALCLSAAVTREISELGWQRIETAERPDQTAMLALVEAEIARRAPPATEAAPEPKSETRTSRPIEASATPQRTAMTEPPRESRRSSGGILVSVFAGAIAAAIVALSAPYWQPMIAPSLPAATTTPDLATIQAKVDQLAAAGTGAVNQDTVNAAINGATGKLDQQITQLSERFAKLEQDVTSLSQTQTTSSAPLDLQALQFRLAKMETDLAQVSAQAGAAANVSASSDLSGEVAALKSGNEALAQQLNTARDHINALESQQAALQAKQTALGGTVDKIAAQPTPVTAADQRRTALVLALGTLRGALSLDKPYAAGLQSIDALLADDAELKAKLAPALEPLRPLGESGAPTMAELQASLPTSAIAEAANAEMTTNAVGADAGWIQRLVNRLSEAVTIRPVGAEVEGDGPLPHLARGEAKLKAGDLAGAVAELEGLTGKAAQVAAPWIVQAKARLAQDQANAMLDQVATALLAPAPEQ